MDKDRLLDERENAVAPGLRTRRQALAMAPLRMRRPWSTFYADVFTLFGPSRCRVKSWLALVLLALVSCSATASEALLEAHCVQCHNDEKSKGKFKTAELGVVPTADNLEKWVDSLDQVAFGDMPPEDESELTEAEREQLVPTWSKR